MQRALIAVAAVAAGVFPFSCGLRPKAPTPTPITAACNDGAVELVYTIPPGDQQVSTELGGQPLQAFTEPASATERTVTTGVADDAGLRFDVLLAGKQAGTVRLPHC